MKSEPESFSIHDLAKALKQTTCWDGVRNYQARNFMRDMKVGELAFFYHSNANPPAIAGIIEIVRAAYPDHTAFDPDKFHIYHLPRWFGGQTFGVVVMIVRIKSRVIGISGADDFDDARDGRRIGVAMIEKR